MPPPSHPDCRATAGTITVAGIGGIARSSALRRHRRTTGIIFQQHHLIGRISALANVLTGRLGYHTSLRTLLPPARVKKISALEALERVGMIAYANRRTDQLSGGQQQRIGIARALVQKPSLILADEPVASLDPATAERTLQLFHDICRSDGITAIVSLHQVELARRFADRVIGLSGGRVVFDGPAAALDDTALVRIYGGAQRTASGTVDIIAPSLSIQAKEIRHETATVAA